MHCIRRYLLVANQWRLIAIDNVDDDAIYRVCSRISDFRILSSSIHAGVNGFRVVESK